MKPKQKYHVKLFARIYNSDDGALESEYVVYEQTTWAVSMSKAESNVRHNSGYPYHGRAMFDSGRWYKVIEAEVTPLFFMAIDGRPVYE